MTKNLRACLATTGGVEYVDPSSIPEDYKPLFYDTEGGTMTVADNGTPLYFDPTAINPTLLGSLGVLTLAEER